MNKRTKLSILLTAILLLGVGLVLAGCAGVQVKGTISCTANSSGGSTCTAKGTVTKTFDVTDPDSPVGAVKEFTYILTKKFSNFFISRAFANSLFDPSSGRIDLTTTNVAVTNTSGSFTIHLYNGTTEIAHNTFSYYRSGSSLYVSDPAAVSNWLNSYDTLYDIATANLGGINVSPTTTAQTTATVEDGIVYQGTTYASSTTSFSINSTTSSSGGKKQF